jgi:hypothetical protein
MKKITSLFFVSILMVGIAVVLTLFGCASVVEETTTTTTLPSVTSAYPADGAISVALSTAVSAVFSKEMDSSTINTTNFKLGSALGLVTGSVTYDAATRTATFSAASLLANAVTYTATIGVGVKDTAGNNMSSAYVWSFTTSSSSAELYYQKNGAVAGDRFGFSVSTVGDVNGDGKSDFIVGAYYADPGGLSAAGTAYVYSGATGTVLYTLNGAAANDYFGFSVSTAGDVNGDGKSDFIVGAYGADPEGLSAAGTAYVYSGATGAVLYTLNGAATGDRFGYSVSTAGDVNGDGKSDFIVGAYGADPGGSSLAGSAYVYSGATGTLLYTLNGAAAGDCFGYSVSTAGDVNGDGKSDFIVGAYLASPAGVGAYAGSAYVYSGATGTVLYTLNGAAASDYFGCSVSTAGDVDGDGKSDFIVGAFYADPGGLSAAGTAYVYSGATGTVLYTLNGAAANDYFGISVSTAGDVNGDGKSDFIVGAYGADPGGLLDAGTAYVYSGATGAVLYPLNGAAAANYFGRSVSTAGDVNGDGKSDFIVGAYGANPAGVGAYAGSAYVYLAR